MSGILNPFALLESPIQRLTIKRLALSGMPAKVIATATGLSEEIISRVLHEELIATRETLH